jgi:hypothetical protein
VRFILLVAALIACAVVIVARRGRRSQIGNIDPTFEPHDKGGDGHA